jgi:peptide/nickel transport system permease protein
VIVAQVLSLPTTGPLLLSSLTSQDMYLAGSLILIVSVLTVIGTLISDICLAWLDPRVRLRYR